MGDKRDNSRKLSWKQLTNERARFVKPDVMLITKDVMIPIVVPPPLVKQTRNLASSPVGKLKTVKTRKHDISEDLPVCNVNDQAPTLVQARPQSNDQDVSSACLPKCLPKIIKPERTQRRDKVTFAKTEELKIRHSGLHSNSQKSQPIHLSPNTTTKKKEKISKLESILIRQTSTNNVLNSQNSSSRPVMFEKMNDKNESSTVKYPQKSSTLTPTSENPRNCAKNFSPTLPCKSVETEVFSSSAPAPNKTSCVETTMSTSFSELPVPHYNDPNKSKDTARKVECDTIVTDTTVGQGANNREPNVRWDPTGLLNFAFTLKEIENQMLNVVKGTFVTENAVPIDISIPTPVGDVDPENITSSTSLMESDSKMLKNIAKNHSSIILCESRNSPQIIKLQESKLLSDSYENEWNMNESKVLDGSKRLNSNVEIDLRNSLQDIKHCMLDANNSDNETSTMDTSYDASGMSNTHLSDNFDQNRYDNRSDDFNLNFIRSESYENKNSRQNSRKITLSTENLNTIRSSNLSRSLYEQILKSNESEMTSNNLIEQNTTLQQRYPGKHEIGKSNARGKFVDNSYPIRNMQIPVDSKSDRYLENLEAVSKNHYSWQNLVTDAIGSDCLNNFIVDQKTNEVDHDPQKKYSWQIISSPESALSIDSTTKHPNQGVSAEHSDEKNSYSREEKTHRDFTVSSKENNSKITTTKYSWQHICSKPSLPDDVDESCGNFDIARYSWQHIDKRSSDHPENDHNSTIVVDDIDKSQNDSDIRFNQLTRAKYSWQNLTKRNRRRTNSIERENSGNDGRLQNTSMQTLISSKDGPSLNAIEPKFEYSWQKLTWKYLPEKHLQNDLDVGQEQASNNNKSGILKMGISPELENAGHALQKRTFDSYLSNHGSQSRLTTMASTNVDEQYMQSALNKTIEKVEIFPSTLRVLGNYIVRDIYPGDLRDPQLLFARDNAESVHHDKQVSDEPTSRRKMCHNNHVEEMETPSMNVASRISNNHTSSNHSPSKTRISSEQINFPSIFSYPVLFDNSGSPPISSVNDRFKPANVKWNDDIIPVIDNDWKNSIEIMDHLIGVPTDTESRCVKNDDTCTNLSRVSNTEPLKPRFPVNNVHTKDAADKNPRKVELLTRLESAMTKLKLCDRNLDTNWNLDYTVLDATESVPTKKKELPKEVKEHIKDIIKSAEEYLVKLQGQLNDLKNADNQIINSSHQTLKDIDEAYQLLMDDVCRVINERRDILRLESEVLKYEGLTPLRACKQEVDAQIRSTQHLIVLTESILAHPETFNQDRLGKIINATSHMGRIPAVPMPEELPYVSFGSVSDKTKKEILERIVHSGCVSRMGPAQITDVLERPACLLIKWHVADPEYSSEEQTFIVQKALGEVLETHSRAFETIYTGSETSCFVRNLPVGEPVTLRVGIQVEETAWSVHNIAKTSIPAYSWDVNNTDYLITNGGHIATKVTTNNTTLFSRGPQVGANFIVEFKFLEATLGSDDEGVGLVSEPNGDNDDLKRIGALLITPNGNIFMHGEQKLMQLPRIQLGTRIVFTTLRRDEDTLRITIECADKAVTYDWISPTPLYFAARFSECNKWNFMVK